MLRNGERRNDCKEIAIKMTTKLRADNDVFYRFVLKTVTRTKKSYKGIWISNSQSFQMLQTLKKKKNSVWPGGKPVSFYAKTTK